MKYIMPLFIESVTSSSLVGDAENDHKTGVKYRVVNLLLGLMPSVLHLAAAGSQEGLVRSETQWGNPWLFKRFPFKNSPCRSKDGLPSALGYLPVTQKPVKRAVRGSPRFPRFGSSIDLHFRSRYTKNLVASVKPSGSEWKSLDEAWSDGLRNPGSCARLKALQHQGGLAEEKPKAPRCPTNSNVHIALRLPPMR